MKTMKRKAICALAAAMTASAAFSAAACGKTGKGDPNTLKVMVTDAGFGLEWMYEIAAEFESVNNVTVKITPTAETAQEIVKVEQDLNDSDVCFFASSDAVWNTIRKHKALNINDVWEAKASEEEDKTIKEKSLAEYAEAYRMIDNNYYSLPFITEVGVLGYNVNTLDAVFGKGQWTLPKTTIELTEMCKEIKKGGAYGFAWSDDTNACYWELLTESWTAQYDGAETYNHARRAEYFDTAANEWKVDPTGETICGYLGRYRVYQQVYDYIKRDDGAGLGGYSHKYCSSMTFIQSQTAFTGGGYGEVDKKQVAFTPTGSWLFEESKAQIEQYALGNISCMNAPILSALCEKLSFYDENKAWDEITDEKRAEYDKALSAIVAYLDGETSEKPVNVGGYTVSEQDIERVREARGVATIKDQSHAFIPANSGNPELAKKFLKFFCSDYAGSLFQSVTHGYTPFYVKAEETNKHLNDFDKEIASIVTRSDDKVLRWSKTGFYLSTLAPETSFFGSNSQYGKPELLYARYKEVNMDKGAWAAKLEGAGLKLL